MFMLIRIVLLNFLWLAMATWAFIFVWGWQLFVAIALWGAIEMLLFYGPVVFKRRAADAELREE